jgi:hypothetical protein
MHAKYVRILLDPDPNGNGGGGGGDRPVGPTHNQAAEDIFGGGDDDGGGQGGDDDGGQRQQQQQRQQQPPARQQQQQRPNNTQRQQQQSDGNQDGQQQDDGQQGGGQQQQQQVANILTPEQIAQLIREGVVAGVQANNPRQQQPQQQLTEEEFRRMTNYANITEQEFLGLFVEDRKQAAQNFQNLIQKAVTQAVTMASLAHNAALEQVNQRFSPALQYVQSAQEKQLQAEFMEANTDLKGYEPLLMAIADQLKKEPGFKTMGKEQAFKTVAERARLVISKMPGAQQQQGGGTQGNGQNGQRQQQTRQPGRMNTLSSGGQAGAGGGGGGQQARVLPSGQVESKTAREIFG